MSPETQQDLTLRDYLAPLVARRWLVAGLVVVIVVAVYSYYATRPKAYEASTKLFVAQEANTLIGTGAGFSDERTVENQATLLTSTDVASAVAQRIGYQGPPSELAAKVSAAPVQGADFIEIRATGTSGRQAAQIANAFAQAFIDVRSADRREQAAKALDELRAQLQRLPRRPENATARAEISSQIRQLQVVASTGPGTAKQIDPAQPPRRAASPRPVRNALLALPLALLGSTLLAYLLHRLDPRIRRVGEAAAVYDRAVIATINHDDGIECFHDGRPALSDSSKEAFRALRVNLALSARERPPRRILVTSASEGEGKSTVVRNLGLALVEAGHNVALVDADLRKASLTSLLGVSSTRGLADVLSGALELGDALTRVPIALPAMVSPSRNNGSTGGTAAPDAVTVLPAGAEASNPPALLGSSEAHRLLDVVADGHDVVLVDTPPLLAVSDTIPLLSWADGVVVVARTGVTDRRNARRAADIIGRVPEAELLGIVVNDLTGPDRASYGSYYGRYAASGRPRAGAAT